MMKQLRKKRQEDAGFTLVELLIVIVIIGILAAVVVLAVGGITDSGSDSACTASKDAATAASVAYYAGEGDQEDWPTSFADLDGLMTPGDGVSALVGTEISGKGWWLTMAPGGTPAGSQEPGFTCATTDPTP